MKLKLFVYGTLKTGFSNHYHYCKGANSIKRACVEGRLFQHPAGYPVLKVPENTILAYGTADIEADLRELERASRITLSRKPTKGLVYGEIMSFNSGEDALSRIDRLEGFFPPNELYYNRVIVPAYTKKEVIPVWVYIKGKDMKSELTLIESGEWLG